MPQDFSGKNLRGRNFKGQNLTGAKFIGADIRGANFTNAILREADFTGAKAGLQQRWQIPLLIIALLIAAAAGCVGAIGGAFVGAFLSENYQKFLSYPGIIFSIVTVIFLMIIIPHGFKSAFEFFLVIAFVFVVILTFSFGLSLEVAGPVSLGLLLTLVFAVEFSLALALTFAGVVSDTFALGVIATLFGSLIALILVAFVKAFAIARAISVVGALVGIYAVTFISGYISKRALADDNRFSWLKSIAIEYATVKGTTFRNADLTDANFTEATLKSTDFRTANLTRTCFRNTEKLDRARVGKSILADTRIRELLITGNGYKKSYVGANLQGANLTGVNLNEANLKQANLNEATLHQANLEFANLTETQALATDFTAARFTGACLEAWNIDGNTKLDRVDCRFVYLLEYPKPGTDDRERCPSSGEFAPVEFTKLFEEVLNTVNLIFRNGIDWKAFVAAFKQLQVENEGTELTIQSIENKGDGVIVVKVSVPPDANKEHIHKNFTQSYELMAARLEDKDKQITFLEGVVIQLAAKPVTIELKAIAESKSTGNQSSNLYVARDAIGSTLNIGNIEGTVTNANNEQLESTEEVEEISQAELQAKDAQIERYREEIAFLREMTIKLAKNPIVINSSPDNKPE